MHTDEKCGLLDSRGGSVAVIFKPLVISGYLQIFPDPSMNHDNS